MIRREKYNNFNPGTIILFVLLLVFAFSFSDRSGGPDHSAKTRNGTPQNQSGFNNTEEAILPVFDGLNLTNIAATPATGRSDFSDPETIYKASFFERSITRIIASFAKKNSDIIPARVWGQFFLLASLHGDELPA